MDKKNDGFIEDAIQEMVAKRTKNLVGEVKQLLQKGQEASVLLTDLQKLYGLCYEEGLKNGIQLADLAEEIETYRKSQNAASQSHENA